MPALARGQENTPSIVNWFLTVNGVLTDGFLVEFQIWDLTAGLPGTQIFPATSGEWENLTTGVGHFSVGSYYAYDNLLAKGWTPGLAEPIGTHRVKWRWKISGAAPFQMGEEDIEVLVESGGGTADHYISVADVRAEGITVAQASDAKVLSYIGMYQQFLERACRQWFVPRSLTFEVDGNDSDTLFFGVPIISLEYLKINGDTNALDPTYYRIYNGNNYPDDRGNPCVKLTAGEERNIFACPSGIGPRKFRRGRKNQSLKGIFGYTERDGSTPSLIKRATLKTVCSKIQESLVSPNPLPPILGSVVSESTDGHSISYGYLAGGFKPKRPGLSGIFCDPEVLDIIKLYRAPIGIASPSSPSYY